MITPFTSAPHRMFFFGGVVQSLLSILWWLADLGGRYGGFYPALSWPLPPIDIHAFLMIYGFFSFFMFGFLMTTFPRWMNGEEVAPRHYIPAFWLMATGLLIFYAGLFAGKIWLNAGLAIYLTGWGTALFALLRVYLRARHPDKLHAAITSTNLALGGMLATAFFSDNEWLIRLAKTGGVWLFLLPVFFAVSFRMIPFFSSTVIPQYQIVRPPKALYLMLAGCAAHTGLELFDLSAWLWLADVPMAVTALYLGWQWQLRKSLSAPLLAMLHIGFAWLGVALLLFALQSLTLLLDGQLLFAKAPLHALTIGYFGSMMLAMVTRVTLGHSGKPLAADRLTWNLFLMFQSIVVLRIAAEIPGLPFAPRGWLYLSTAALWLICFGIWSARYAMVYWRPRTDGKPG